MGLTPLGTLMWTASSAGWFVLACITGIAEAWLTSAGCAIMAVMWHWIQQQGRDPEKEESDGS